MILLWISASALFAFFIIVLHTLVTRWLDPADSRRSMKRFWMLFCIRIVFIGTYFWQLVQQDVFTLVAGFVVFLAVYASSLYFIINRKPQWFQPELKKETPAWMK
jgi:hypothetical protein